MNPALRNKTTNHNLLLLKRLRDTHTKVELCQLTSPSDISQQTTIFHRDVRQTAVAFDVVFTSYSGMPWLVFTSCLLSQCEQLIIPPDLLLSASTEKQIVTIQE